MAGSHTVKDLDGKLEVLTSLLNDASLILCGLDGVIFGWTAGCERLYGWTQAEAVGQVAHELLEAQFPEPLDQILETFLRTQQWNGVVIHRHRDGRSLHVSTRWVAADVDAPASVIIQTNNDVTEMKVVQDSLADREAHLSSILDTVPDAMIVIDERGAISSFSHAAEKLFGYQSHEVCGRNVKILMPSVDRDSHDGYLADYLRTGEKHIIGDGRVVTGQRKDQTQFAMELAVGEAVAGGKRIFTGFIRDLTSRHIIEEELRQSQKMEAIGQLSGGLAHDFNNLLTVISGNLEMVEEKVHDEGLLVLLREAQDAADDGAKLTGQLLAFGRRQPLHPKLVNVAQLVSGFSDIMRRTLGEAIEFHVSCLDAAPHALVDAPQLQNAILNLVINARDAMPGGGKLTIEISHVKLDFDYAQMYVGVRTGTYVLLSVTDTGAGMTPEVKKKALEPFFTTKGPGAGTGLGLSMVYGFVKQSGGNLQIYSEPGQGTSIRIFLPSAKARSSAVRPLKVTRVMPGGTEKILVVEDDARVRRVAVARLTKLGYDVVEAQNGAVALEQLEAHHDVALLFTDIVMPGGMAGDELADLARQTCPALKTLFTSGYAEPAIAGRELSLSGNWIKKPYTSQDLATRVRELLDHPLRPGVA